MKYAPAQCPVCGNVNTWRGSEVRDISDNNEELDFRLIRRFSFRNDGNDRNVVEYRCGVCGLSDLYRI